MTLSGRLWAENTDLAAAALDHPFVRSLADGSLDPDVFAAFIAQDAFFLDAFARAYALGSARSTDTDTRVTLADLIAGVAGELAQHAETAASLGIDLAATVAAPATLGYTDFLLATAATEPLGTILAAMTPCMRLYSWLGRSLEEAPSGRYAHWVRTYADPRFEQLAARLEQLVDVHAADEPTVHGAYRRAMQLELAFFDSARPRPS